MENHNILLALLLAALLALLRMAIIRTALPQVMTLLQVVVPLQILSQMAVLLKPATIPKIQTYAHTMSRVPVATAYLVVYAPKIIQKHARSFYRIVLRPPMDAH